MIEIILVAGARPNFMKVASLAQELFKYPDQFQVKIVHTGQHYDTNMSDVFFKDLEIPPPDIHFGIGSVGSGSHAEQTARIIMAFEEYCQKENPDLVVVVGDVNSTLACAVVAKKLHLQLAHVEAGLRSFDRSMPEEINRIVTDSISDLLFVTEKTGVDNLRREGHQDKNIFFVGNLMIDTLIANLGKLKNRSPSVDKQQYALVTLHRPSNVDQPERMRFLIHLLKEIRLSMPVIFPAHPRTQKNIRDFGLTYLLDGISIMNPVGYLDFLSLMKHATCCLTDSGGIQEETTVLGIPCLTLRENTERPVTISEGTNTLGLDKDQILANIHSILGGTYKKGRIPDLWDGHAAVRIREILQKIY